MPSKIQKAVRNLSAKYDIRNTLLYTAVVPYKDKLINIVKEIGLTLDQVYNADEGGHFGGFCLKRHSFTVLKRVLRDENWPKTE